MRLQYIVLGGCLCLLLLGCDDIFEQNIENTSIQIVAPKHGMHVEAGEVMFLWRPIAGARNYRLTIVSPDFLNASRVWADTLLMADSVHAADRFLLSLDTGTYQWSLSAANGVYRSKERVLTLIVDPVTPPEASGTEDNPDSAEQEELPLQEEQKLIVKSVR